MADFAAGGGDVERADTAGSSESAARSGRHAGEAPAMRAGPPLILPDEDGFGERANFGGLTSQSPSPTAVQRAAMRDGQAGVHPVMATSMDFGPGPEPPVIAAPAMNFQRSRSSASRQARDCHSAWRGERQGPSGVLPSVIPVAAAVGSPADHAIVGEAMRQAAKRLAAATQIASGSAGHRRGQRRICRRHAPATVGQGTLGQASPLR